MNYYTLFYLIGVLDKLAEVLLALVTIFGFLTVIMIIVKLIAWSENDIKPAVLKAIKRYFKLSIIGFAVFLIFYTVTPSKKDVLLIVAGGSIAEFVENNETAKELPNDVIEYFKRELAEPK